MTTDSEIIYCGDSTESKCHIHDRYCAIPLKYPDGDSRNESLTAAKEAGAPTHISTSLHYCDLCVIEREEGRQAGFYQQDEHDGRIKPLTVIERQSRERDEGVIDAEFVIDEEE